MMSSSSSASWYAIYDNVTIGPAPTYTLLSVGNIYGNAGDGFSLSLGYNFELDSGTNSQWWWPADATSRKAFCNGNAACVTQFNWGPLSNHSITVNSISMRVRPQEYDSGINCPVINVMSLPYQPNSYYMLANVSQSRAPGANISYQCLREYRMEGPTGGPYTTQGVSTCQGVPGSGDLVWSRNLTLPCQLRCPDTFQQWSDANTCYNVSMDRAVMGISGAALRCSQVNASLAVVLNATDLQNLNSTDFYLTAHIVNNTNSIQPALPQSTTCVGVCPPVSGGPRCVVVNQAGQYKAGDCTSTDFRYICQLPPVCPAGYTPYRGNCYKLRVNVAGGIVAAQSTCEGDEASLAYPQTVDTVQFMARLNISSTGITGGIYSGSAMIGINDVGGNWSAGGLYPLDAGVINMTTSSTVTSTSHWRAVTVSSGTITSLTVISTLNTTTTLTNTYITKAICQLYGPVGCWTPPPPPTVNMTQAWSNSTQLGTTVNYTCTLGYYVNGNISRTYQVLTCYGLVGGWYPPLLYECYHVPVCNSIPPVSPKYITNTTDIEYRYLGGTINYTCPYMMAVNGTGATTQTITCIANITSFNFSPLRVQPCTVCLGQPNITNATTDWLGSNTYLINNTVNATCDADHLFKIGATSSPIPCLPTGWGNGTCYEGCVMDPPVPGANMTRSNTTTYAVGTTIAYTCAPGYNIPPTAVNQTYQTSVNVTCNASSHSWAAGGLLECAKLCTVDPLKVLAPANSSWDGFSRVAGTQVTYTCPSGYAFADLNTTIVLTCGDTGQWTPATPSLLTCRKVCPTSLPATPVNATQVGAVFPYWVGDSVTFRCPKDMQSARANTSVSLNCSDTGWSALDPQFGCYNVCGSAPPFVLYGNSSWDGVNIIFGSQVTLSCPGTLSLGDLNHSLTVTCQDDGNWTYVDPDILICRQECTATLPTLPTNASLEGPPAPYWVGTHVNFTCDLGTASPTGGTYDQLECLDGGWTPLVPGFMCIPACVAAPPAAGDAVTSNNTGVQVYGTVITYTCAYTFYNDTYILNTLCDEGNWTLATLPKCALGESWVYRR
nr:uncharacterized protein LOC123745520 [Procambarus clarkii]